MAIEKTSVCPFFSRQTALVVDFSRPGYRQLVRWTRDPRQSGLHSLLMQLVVSR
jgi:hypothetical protein